MRYVAYIAALLSLVALQCLAQTKQTTSGACSPPILENVGTISVTCNVLVATTSIGGTTVPAQRSTEESFRRANRSAEVYVDENLMFGISWPKQKDASIHNWQPSEGLDTDYSAYGPGGIRAFGLSFLVHRYEWGSIDVVVTNKVFFTIEEVLDSFIRHQKRGVTVVSASIDQAHSGAILVLRGHPESNYGIVRVLLGDAFTYYVVMEDTYPQTKDYIELRNEANLIFNSFRLLHR